MTFDVRPLYQTNLPPEVCDASAWYGVAMMQQGDWVERLEKEEVEELGEAVRRIENSGSDLAAMTADVVPLPTLGPRLQRLLDEVLNGRGFVVIKGLPVERWTRRRAALAFLAMGVHLGR